MKQNSFSPAQNGGIGADSECQTKNGQEREGGVAAESAEAEAHILSELVRPEPHTLFPRELLPLFDTAKFPKRCVARFTGRHAGRDFPFRCFIEVLVDFLGYLRIALVLSERAEKTPARCADYFHGSGCRQNEIDPPGDARPMFSFRRELSSARCGQFVVARLSIAF